MAFATNGIVGANLAGRTTTPEFALGTLFSGNDGSEWMYVLAGAAITVYDTLHIDQAFSANPMTDALALTNGQIGFAQSAFASADYGFVMKRGKPVIRVVANTQDDLPLYTTGTPGVLDDATGSLTHHQVMGLILATSVSASQSTATAIATFPQIRRPAD